MYSPLLAFASSRPRLIRPKRSGGRLFADHGGAVALSTLSVGAVGTIEHVHPDPAERAERLLALGVTPGARVEVRQTFPAIVFVCDQTELAVEWAVAELILVRSEEE